MKLEGESCNDLRTIQGRKKQQLQLAVDVINFARVMQMKYRMRFADSSKLLLLSGEFPDVRYLKVSVRAYAQPTSFPLRRRRY